MGGVVKGIRIRGYLPFDADKPEKIFKKTITQDINLMNSTHWDNISANAKNLLHRLVRKNPEERITLEDALQHPWITVRPQILPALAYTP